ncbi:MAG: DNA polymerase III subunit beta [Lentisphaeria bacterium]|nr:DNA polymerase III subunit beta [Lentisphaeria bacterium]
MKITVSKEDFLEAMTPAMSAVSERNTITQLEGVLITTEGADKCVLSTYDLEKGYRTVVNAQVKEPGSYIINAAKLYRMVRTMPDATVTIFVNEKFQAKISSGNSVFSLSALPGGDFPKLPELDGDVGVTLGQGMLKKIIGQVNHAIGKESQPILTGAYFKVTEDGLRVVSCDGNRMALREKECSLKLEGKEEGFSFIVPGKTLIELMKMLSSDDEEEVALLFGRKHVIFRMNENIFFSRLIDGDYIDYRRVIPKNNNIHVTLDREELVDCLERVSLVTDDKSVGQTHGYVKCVFEGDTLKVSSASSVSAVFDELPIEKEGNDITIGFNCRFLLDALRAIDESRVKFSLATPLMSMIIEKADDAEEESDGKEEKEDSGKFLYMVCPVKMKE